jgi:hypothetical protein
MNPLVFLLPVDSGERVSFTIISTITTRRTHIGFDDTGTELATSVRKMAYESNKVIPKETL